MTERIADGVHRLQPGGASCYVVETNDGLVLIDCATPGNADAIIDGLHRSGLHDGRIDHILVTHHHVDHVGSLADMARRTDADVWVGAVDAPFVRGERAAPGPRAGVGSVLWPVLRRVLPTVEPTAVDHEFIDGADVDLPLGPDARVVHTPGHTPGHVAFLLPRDGGVLIAGDAASNVGGTLRSAGHAMMAVVCHDRPAADRSLAVLAGHDFEVAVFGHGRPITAGASDRFADLLAGR